MLKFNIKEHKLEELEKYGFDKSCDYYLTKDCIFGIKIENLELEINDDYSLGYTNKIETLYDLIKDGLIIKE